MIRSHICICILICICVCMCISICISICIGIYLCICICIFVDTYIYISISICTCVRICMHCHSPQELRCKAISVHPRSASVGSNMKLLNFWLDQAQFRTGMNKGNLAAYCDSSVTPRSASLGSNMKFLPFCLVSGFVKVNSERERTRGIRLLSQDTALR